MDLLSMIATLYPQGSPVQPTSQQVDILNHATGPAWVLAGPGSGKTEVLSLLVLRLLYVNNDPIQPARIPPESIFVTTRSEEHTSELQSLMRISYAVFCLKKKRIPTHYDTNKYRQEIHINN